MEFRSRHTIETAENVSLQLELAGVASRVFAFGLDALVMLTLMGLLMLSFAIFPILRSHPEIGKTLLPIGLFLIMFGYHLFQEWLWNGRTVGKSILNIRAVRENGQALGFWEAFGRNLLRVVDVYLSGIGLVVMLFNRDEKRLGDFVAGTLVISEQAIGRGRALSAGTAARAPADEIRLPAVRLLSSEEIELLRRFKTERGRWFPQARASLSEALCRYFSERLHTPVQTEADLDALLNPGAS